MDAYSGYLYVALWLVLAIYMFYLALKESKFFFVLSGFFLFMSGWFLFDEILTQVDMFSGIYSTIFRLVAVAVLFICIVVYIKSKRKNNKNSHNSQEK